jgi:receptor protein-tyrosine kinase
MVVEASGTSRRHVAQAFAAVEQCPNVVSVLNKCEAVSEWAAYGGYYG